MGVNKFLLGRPIFLANGLRWFADRPVDDSVDGVDFGAGVEARFTRVPDNQGFLALVRKSPDFRTSA